MVEVPFIEQFKTDFGAKLHTRQPFQGSFRILHLIRTGIRWHKGLVPRGHLYNTSIRPRKRATEGRRQYLRSIHLSFTYWKRMLKKPMKGDKGMSAM